MKRFAISFDTDVWVRVPVDFSGEQWSDSAEWAEWVADAATRDREADTEMHEALRAGAQAIADFSTQRVSARFWHYPVAGEPGGWVDFYVQRVSPTTADAEALLPPSTAAIEPMIVPLVDTEFESAVRRLGLIAVSADANDDSGIVGTAGAAMIGIGEWSAVAGEWAVRLVAGDSDVAALGERVGDIDRLLAGIDPAELAALAVAE